MLGSNGAGKTTLFNCVTGDFLPTSGTIRLFGEDLTNFPAHERIRRGLRRTYQISLLFGGMSVADNVYLACLGVSRGRFSLLRPRPSDAILSATVRRTTGSSSSGPVPAECERTSARCNSARRASSIRVRASRPNPVLTP